MYQTLTAQPQQCHNQQLLHQIGQTIPPTPWQQWQQLKPMYQTLTAQPQQCHNQQLLHQILQTTPPTPWQQWQILKPMYQTLTAQPQQRHSQQLLLQSLNHFCNINQISVMPVSFLWFKISNGYSHNIHQICQNTYENFLSWMSDYWILSFASKCKFGECNFSNLKDLSESYEFGKCLEARSFYLQKHIFWRYKIT